LWKNAKKHWNDYGVNKAKYGNKKEKLIVGFRAENAMGIFGMQIAQEFSRLLMLTGLCIQ